MVARNHPQKDPGNLIKATALLADRGRQRACRDRRPGLRHRQRGGDGRHRPGRRRRADLVAGRAPRYSRHRRRARHRDLAFGLGRRLPQRARRGDGLRRALRRRPTSATAPGSSAMPGSWCRRATPRRWLPGWAASPRSVARAPAARCCGPGPRPRAFRGRRHRRPIPGTVRELQRGRARSRGRVTWMVRSALGQASAHAVSTVLARGPANDPASAASALRGAADAASSHPPR